MVFNIMIGNTDDHLQNFIMLHDDSGWRLSPAFDLLPNIGFNQEHVLRIGMNTLPPNAAALLVRDACLLRALADHRRPNGG
jgi:serine/threonine-protein kinase HipA